MKVFAIFGQLFLILISFVLLFFTCIHYANFWSYFIILPVGIAFFVPVICFGYSQSHEQNSDLDPQRLQSCKQFGWSLTIVLFIATYGIPVLAWYNSGFYWGGVLLIFTVLTFWGWAYLLWIRVFVFL